jgi:hypothetical protein
MMHVLIACSLGLAAAVALLWRIERNQAARKAARPAGAEALDLADPARTAAAMAAAEAFGPDPAEDCLCSQCEQGPGCPRTFPDCLHRPGGDPEPAA